MATSRPKADTVQNTLCFLGKAMNKHYIRPRCLILDSDRRVVLEKARQQHPQRWIGGRVMRCEGVGSLWVTPDRQESAIKAAA